MIRYPVPHFNTYGHKVTESLNRPRHSWWFGYLIRYTTSCEAWDLRGVWHARELLKISKDKWASNSLRKRWGHNIFPKKNQEKLDNVVATMATMMRAAAKKTESLLPFMHNDTEKTEREKTLNIQYKFHL
uniref:Large ribosomal subunit protein eL36 n=1 Tax=Spermophilus dauricus TaxID=99837 RepID=A0A8C9USN1_SPEDA